MEKLSDLFGKRATPPKKIRSSERGDIFETIMSHMNPDRKRKGLPPITPSRLAYLLTGIPTKDLYALLSNCADADRRGVPWSAAFWTEIKPRD